MKSWLEKNDIEIYSTHNEGKPLLRDLLEKQEQDLQIHDFNFKKCVY